MFSYVLSLFVMVGLINFMRCWVSVMSFLLVMCFMWIVVWCFGMVVSFMVGLLLVVRFIICM